MRPRNAGSGRSSTLDPSDSEVYGLLARSLPAAGKVEEARKELEAVVQRQPDAVGAHTMIGSLTHVAEPSQEDGKGVPAGTGSRSRRRRWRQTISPTCMPSGITTSMKRSPLRERPPSDSSAAADSRYGGLGLLQEGAARAGDSAVPGRRSKRSRRNPIYHYHLGLAYRESRAAGQGEGAHSRRRCV